MEKIDRMNSKQVDLLEKLRLYKEQKAQKKQEVGTKTKQAAKKTFTSLLGGCVAAQRPGNNGPVSRRILSAKHSTANNQPANNQPANKAKQTIQARSIASSRPASFKPTNRTNRSCPTAVTKLKDEAAREKRAPIKRLSFSKVDVQAEKMEQENRTPTRKRKSSFTVDDASPHVKRPVIEMDTAPAKEVRAVKKAKTSDDKKPEVNVAQRRCSLRDSSTRKEEYRRQMLQKKSAPSQPRQVEQKVVKPTVAPVRLLGCASKPAPTREHRNKSPQRKPAQSKEDIMHMPGMSMREKLELWRKQKESTVLVPEKSTKDVGVTAFTKRVPGSQVTAHQRTKTAPVSSTLTAWRSNNHPVRTRDSSVDRRKSHADAMASRKTEQENAFQRRKSYANQLNRNVVSNKPKTVASSPKFRRPAPVSSANMKLKSQKQTDNHRRSTTCSLPVAPKMTSTLSAKDNALQRRKSYALSLRNQLVTQPTGKGEHKRRTTIAGTSCLKRTRDTGSDSDTQPSVTKRQKQSPVRQSPRLARASILVNRHVTPKTMTPEATEKATTTPDIELQPMPRLTPDTLPAKTPKSTRKSMSVRFAASPSPEKCAEKTPGTPHPKPAPDTSVVLATPVTASRLSPIKKESSIRKKLNDWLTSHGKTPTRFSHMLKFGDHLSSSSSQSHVIAGGLSAGELSLQFASLEYEQKALAKEDSLLLTPNTDIEDPLTQKLDAILSECLILLESDCPTDTVDEWLSQICSNLEGVQRVAKYWVCRARIAQRTGDDNAVIGVFEESVRHNAQPPEEVAEALKEFVDHMSEKQAKRRQSLDSSLAMSLPSTPQYKLPVTPQCKARDIQEENMFSSSAIKYCYTETTPFFSRLRMKARRNRSTPYAVVTPVRRSTRRSVNNLPSMLKDHDMIVESLSHLTIDKKEQALFVPNHALHSVDGTISVDI